MQIKQVMVWCMAVAAVCLLMSGFGATEPELFTPGAKKDVPGEPETVPDAAAEILCQLTLEEKAAQLFMVTPEQLTGGGAVTQIDEAVRQAFRQYPVGGMIFFAGNLQDAAQVTKMTTDLQLIADGQQGIPLFLAIDEEGGDVARIGNHKGFQVPKIPQMKTIGNSQQPDKACEAGSSVGSYLAEYGFNVDFAPVADALTNPDNAVVKNRSFGRDPQLVTEMVAAYLDGLESHGVYGVPKHFPGHGATEGDSHHGFAYANKTWAELAAAELVPFYAMVERKTPFIMVGHISLPVITGDDTPGSLSPQIIRGYLREVMDYEGIIITDALNMGAIRKYYSAEEAAVMTLEAGADMILMPADFPAAYAAVLEAVRSGRISEARLDESVLRILKAKAQMTD